MVLDCTYNVRTMYVQCTYIVRTAMYVHCTYGPVRPKNFHSECYPYQICMYGLVRTMYVHCTYICPLGSSHLAQETMDTVSSSSLSVEIFQQFAPVVGSQSMMFANGEEGRAQRRVHDPCFAYGAVCNMIPTFQKVRIYNRNCVSE